MAAWLGQDILSTEIQARAACHADKLRALSVLIAQMPLNKSLIMQLSVVKLDLEN